VIFLDKEKNNNPDSVSLAQDCRMLLSNEQTKQLMEIDGFSPKNQLCFTFDQKFKNENISYELIILITHHYIIWRL
jgi:hypothetical protein